jgi:hypothetical protein
LRSGIIARLAGVEKVIGEKKQVRKKTHLVFIKKAS